MQRAEVAAYFNQFEIAETLYLDNDRCDLAIRLRNRLGDYFRVMTLSTEATVGNDTLVEQCSNSIGEYYIERQRPSLAAFHFQSSKNLRRLVECHYINEEYEEMEKISRALPDGHELLRELGERFTSIGMAKEAMDAFVKCGDFNEAINAAVSLNQWGRHWRRFVFSSVVMANVGLQTMPSSLPKPINSKGSMPSSVSMPMYSWGRANVCMQSNCFARPITTIRVLKFFMKWLL